MPALRNTIRTLLRSIEHAKRHNTRFMYLKQSTHMLGLLRCFEKADIVTYYEIIREATSTEQMRVKFVDFNQNTVRRSVSFENCELGLDLVGMIHVELSMRCFTENLWFSNYMRADHLDPVLPYTAFSNRGIPVHTRDAFIVQTKNGLFFDSEVADREVGGIIVLGITCLQTWTDASTIKC